MTQVPLADTGGGVALAPEYVGDCAFFRIQAYIVPREQYLGNADSRRITACQQRRP